MLMNFPVRRKAINGRGRPSPLHPFPNLPLCFTADTNNLTRLLWTLTFDLGRNSLNIFPSVKLNVFERDVRQVQGHAIRKPPISVSLILGGGIISFVSEQRTAMA